MTASNDSDFRIGVPRHSRQVGDARFLLLVLRRHGLCRLASFVKHEESR